MLVIACPGQGAQKSGFLSSWSEIPSFAASLEELSAAADLDLAAHGTTSDDETIKDTAVAQPLLVAAAIASSRELLRDLPAPQIVAGHSVGEIGAAQIAGVLTAAEAMEFVRIRATGMAAAAAIEPTGMAAVVGGVAEDVVEAIRTAGLAPANVNGGGQIVAAGTLDAIAAFKDTPPERARVIPLAVAGAFHTDYMAPARAALAEYAAGLAPADPSIELLTNRDGSAVGSGRTYVDLLVDQVTNPVRWDACQETLLARGVTGLLELTPGGTLTGLAKRGLKGVETFALKSAEDLDAARAFVAAHA